LTCVVVLKTLWHYRASVWYWLQWRSSIQMFFISFFHSWSPTSIVLCHW